MSDTTNEDIVKALTDLRTDVTAFRTDVCAHLHDHDTMLRDVTDQVSALTEGRRSNSMRTKMVSDSNLQTEAKLAEEIVARQAVQKDVSDLKESNVVQLAILQRLDKVAANPTIKLILTALGIVVAGWLATKGLK